MSVSPEGQGFPDFLERPTRAGASDAGASVTSAEPLPGDQPTEIQASPAWDATALRQTFPQLSDQDAAYLSTRIEAIFAASDAASEEQGGKLVALFDDMQAYRQARRRVRHSLLEHYRDQLRDRPTPHTLDATRYLGKVASSVVDQPRARALLGELVADMIYTLSGLQVELQALSEGRRASEMEGAEYTKRLKESLRSPTVFREALRSQWDAYLEALTGTAIRVVGTDVRDTAPPLLVTDNAPPATPDPPARPESDQLPAVIRQATFAEAKAMAISFADGPSLRHWGTIEGELALRHSRPDKYGRAPILETKLAWPPALDWLGVPKSLDSLRKELEATGISASLLLYLCLGAVLGDRFYVKLDLDDLITRLGWDPRSRKERQELRLKVWRWLVIFASLEVIGRRKGTYRDPDTREIIDTASRGPLLQLGDREVPDQLAFDDSAVPLQVEIAAGSWLDRFRGNRKMLADFGDVAKITAIPAGKPSGAWGRAIGLALNQLWREESAEALVGSVGDDHRQIVRYRPFTRRELLTLFPPVPSVEEVLSSANPKRARDYWREGIGFLKEQRLIGYYPAKDEPPLPRKGWADVWLDYPLDIRPSEEGRADTAAIAKRARDVKRRIRRRQKAPAAGV